MEAHGFRYLPSGTGPRGAALAGGVALPGEARKLPFWILLSAVGALQFCIQIGKAPELFEIRAAFAALVLI